MGHAWIILHNYVFKDLSNQLEFLVTRVLPQLIAHNDSLTIFETRYFLMDLSQARVELYKCFSIFQNEIYKRFLTIDNEESTFVVRDYLSDARLKHKTIDWFSVCTEQIFRIEQVSAELFT